MTNFGIRHCVYKSAAKLRIEPELLITKRHNGLPNVGKQGALVMIHIFLDRYKKYGSFIV